jgi:hypothetical protein
MKDLAARTALLLLLVSMSAFAADVAGSWKLTYTTENGLTREATLDLKLEAGHLSGTLAGDRGKAQIEEGTVSGDQVSFTLLRRGNNDEIKVTYQGKVEGGTMKLKMQYGHRPPVEVSAKRIS